jgi:hypothetical protein
MEGPIYLAGEWNIWPSLCYKRRSRRLKKKKQEANSLLGCGTVYSGYTRIPFQTAARLDGNTSQKMVVRSSPK